MSRSEAVASGTEGERDGGRAGAVPVTLREAAPPGGAQSGTV
ncbi:hypothetical protein ACIBI3_33655 [Actinomadura luteofluorescens]